MRKKTFKAKKTAIRWGTMLLVALMTFVLTTGVAAEAPPEDSSAVQNSESSSSVGDDSSSGSSIDIQDSSESVEASAPDDSAPPASTSVPSSSLPPASSLPEADASAPAGSEPAGEESTPAPLEGMLPLAPEAGADADDDIPVAAPQLGTGNWSSSLVIIPNAGVGPGTNLQFYFNLTISTYDADDMSGLELVFQFNKKHLASVDMAGNKIPVGNPSIGNTQHKLFKENFLTRDTSKDSGDMVGYTIHLTDDPAAITELINLGSLANAALSFQATMNSYLEEGGRQTIISYPSDENNTIVDGTIDIDQSGNPQPGSVTSWKRIAGVFENQGGNYVKRDFGNGSPYVAMNDIVIFQVQLKNAGVAPIKINHITDYLPTTYDYKPFGDTIQLNGSTQTIADMAASVVTNPALSSFLSGTQPPWSLVSSTASSKEYKLDLKAMNSDNPLELAQNEQYVTYIAAKVTDATIGKTRENKMQVNQEGATPGPVGSGEPAVQGGGMDLALTTTVSHLFDANREFIAQGLTGSSINKDTYLAVKYTVINQGDTAKAIHVAAYIPKGYDIVTDSGAFSGQGFDIPKSTNDGFGWASYTTIPESSSTGVWSDLDIYTVELKDWSTDAPKTLLPGEQADIYLYLKAPNVTTNLSEYPHFYIGGEIYYFTTELGGAAPDVDSTPDFIPGNDLEYNSTYYPIINGGKEFHGKINEHAIPASSLQDEDDFDFDYITVREAGTVSESFNTLLKNRISASSINSAGGISNQGFYNYTIGNNILNAGYTPVPDTGLIPGARSFVMYEMWINKDGSKDIEGFTFEDTLPEGLEIMSVGGGSGNIDTVKLEKYNPIVRVNGKISYEKQGVRYTSTAFHSVPVIPNGANNLNTNYTMPSANALMGHTTSKLSAAGCGVTGSISSDRRTLKIHFGTPSSSLASETSTDSAWRILMICAINPAVTDFQPMRNTARLHKNQEEYSATESSDLKWTLDGGLAVIQKSARMSDSEDYVTNPTVLSAAPGPDGSLVVDYQIRYLSLHTFVAGMIRVVDTIDPQHFDSFVGNIEYSGRQFTLGPNNEVILGADLATVPLEATTNNNVLTIANPTQNSAANEAYFVRFKVRYKNWQYGDAILNEAGGSQVLSSIPLRLQVLKADANTKQALGGYEFKAYYAAADGSADLNRPVKDLNDADLVFTDSANTHCFRPEGHKYGVESSWDVVLVETLAPAGYEHNVNSNFTLRIVSDKTGDLSIVGTQGSEALYTITYNPQDATATATLYNNAQDESTFPLNESPDRRARNTAQHSTPSESESASAAAGVQNSGAGGAPQTGDSASPLWPLLVLAASLLGITLFILYRKRQTKA